MPKKFRIKAYISLCEQWGGRRQEAVISYQLSVIADTIRPVIADTIRPVIAD
jgi:hypothetical protein